MDKFKQVCKDDLGVVPPPDVAEISYGDHGKVNLGNLLTPTIAKVIPKQLNWKSHPKQLYCIALLDPDSPSPKDPKNKEFLHWLITNVPGPNAAKGNAVAEYVGPTPSKDNGPNRYVFLIFRQHHEETPNERQITRLTASGRTGFKISNFAKKYKFGDPIAGNFFTASFDDSVPATLAQLGL